MNKKIKTNYINDKNHKKFQPTKPRAKIFRTTIYLSCYLVVLPYRMRLGIPIRD